MRDFCALEKHLCRFNNEKQIWWPYSERVGAFYRSFLAEDEQMTGQLSRCDITKQYIRLCMGLFPMEKW